MDAEDWQDHRELEKAERLQRQKFNTELCLHIAAECGYEVETIAPHQLRITIRGLKLDYFPQSGKAMWLVKNKWFRIDDIEMFLERELTNKKFKADGQ